MAEHDMKVAARRVDATMEREYDIAQTPSEWMGGGTGWRAVGKRAWNNEAMENIRGRLDLHLNPG
jgi:hypothetical protein